MKRGKLLKKITSKLRGLGSSRVTAAVAGGIAVLLLGGGTAVASGHIGGDDIRNYSIDKQHLRKNSVGSWEALDRSLVGGDIKKDSVGRNVWTPYLRSMIEEWESGEFSKPGPEGPKGEKGDPGQDGADGKDGVSGMETHKPSASIVAVAPGETATATATCAEGLRALSGGYDVKDASQEVRDQAVVTKNGPGPDASFDGTNFGGWEVTVTNSGEAGTFNVYPYVVCAAVN